MSHTARIDELRHSEPVLSYNAQKIYWPTNTTRQSLENMQSLNEGQATFRNGAVRRDSVRYSNPDYACQSRKIRDISQQISTTTYSRPQPLFDFAYTSVPFSMISPTRRGPFRCSECQKLYSQRGWLKNHLRDAHLMEQKHISSTSINQTVESHVNTRSNMVIRGIKNSMVSGGLTSQTLSCRAEGPNH